MTSERPSTLAAPSPISRTTPTFERVTAVLIPAICDSSSWRMLLIALVKVGSGKKKGEASGEESAAQVVEAGFDAAVPDGGSNLDAHTADEIRTQNEICGEVLAVNFLQFGAD